MSSMTRFAIGAFVAFVSPVVPCQDKEETTEIQWENGEVILGDGLASLSLPEGFGFIRDALARAVVESWGNPPDPSVIGLIADLIDKKSRLR